MGQIILHMVLEHCCPEPIMVHTTHSQEPSRISRGRVQSLHYSNQEKSQHPYKQMETYIDEASAPFSTSTWQALEQYPPTGGLQP